MPNFNEKELLYKLKKIEDTLQQNETDTEKLKQVVYELREVIASLDKDMAIQSEKQSHLFFRIEQIQKEVQSLEGKGEKTNEKHRDLLENALMVLLGGVITYRFSMAKG